MANFDNNELLTEIKLRGFIPSNPSSFADTDLLLLATKEMFTNYVPMLLSVREEYWVGPPKDYSITLNVDSYLIPSRAVGNRLRDVQFLDTFNVYRKVPEISPSELADLNAFTTTAQSPKAFYLRDSYVVIYPVPNQSIGILRLLIHRRPNRLVLPTTGASGNIGVIASIAGDVLNLTAAPPSVWTTTTALDVVRAIPNFDWLATDIIPTAIGGSSVTFPAGTISTLSSIYTPSVGDYVCTAQSSPVPQLPAELHTPLAIRTALTAIKAMGRTEHARNLEAEVVEDEKKALYLIQPRIEGKPEKIVNRSWL